MRLKLSLKNGQGRIVWVEARKTLIAYSGPCGNIGLAEKKQLERAKVKACLHETTYIFYF